jgi:hypothetical protein
MIMLATQPIKPPTTSQMMKFMMVSLLVVTLRLGDRDERFTTQSDHAESAVAPL